LEIYERGNQGDGVSHREMSARGELTKITFSLEGESGTEKAHDWGEEGGNELMRGATNMGPMNRKSGGSTDFETDRVTSWTAAMVQ